MGTLSGVAAPCPGASGDLPATVLVSINKGGQLVARLNLSSPFTFSLALPQGAYRVVSAGGSQVDVNIASGQTTSVALPATCG